MSKRLNQIQIPTPCPVSWESMTGDDTVRHCSQCACNVYDLSAIPAKAGERLLEQASGGICVQIVRRPDGTLVTADAPVETPRQTFGRWLVLSAASLMGLAGCEKEPSERTGGKMVQPADDNAPVRLGGAVAPPMNRVNQQIRGEVAMPTPNQDGECLRGKVLAPTRTATEPGSGDRK